MKIETLIRYIVHKSLFSERTNTGGGGGLSREEGLIVLQSRTTAKNTTEQEVKPERPERRPLPWVTQGPASVGLRI